MLQKILRLSEIKNVTGLSRSSIYLRISEQRFPKPINLGGRAVGWLEDEVEAWVDQQVQQSRPSARGNA